MTFDPDHGFGLLSPEDQEKLERILAASGGIYGATDIHGMLTASVVGPKPIPLDWIVQRVLDVPGSEGKGFNHHPEFNWVAEKIGEWILRISRVFQQDPEMFRLLVYRPNLEEGDTTPNPLSWCFGFVEGMMYHREDWKPLLSMAFMAVAPIVMTADPDEWREENDLNPFKEMAPSRLCECLKIATQTIHAFWPFYHKYRGPIRAPVAPGRNQPCACGSGRKFKRCCGR
jgi:uncharacterized protein